MKKIYWISAILGLSLLALTPTLFTIQPLKKIWISELENKLGGQVDVQSAHFSWFGPQKLLGFKYVDPQIQASAEEITSPLPFWRIRNFSKRFILRNGQVNVAGITTLQKIEAEIDPSAINVQGSSQDGGVFQAKQSGDQIEFDFQKTPTILFDRWFQTKGLLTDAVGPTFDLEGTFQIIDQSIALKLASPLANAEILGKKSQNAFLLTSPLLASLKVTPTLTQRLTLPNATGSLLLKIEPLGFEFPLKMNLKQIKIKDGQINPGIFQISSTSLLENVGSVLKSSSLFKRPSLEVRSTPLDFSLEDGILTLQRLDFLINRAVHFCLWGDVNLISRSLDLNLGITAQTLMSILGIQGLQSGAVLKIPIRGSIDEPKLDTKQATAKIAALTATQLVPKKGLFQLLPKVVELGLDDQREIPPQRYPIE